MSGFPDKRLRSRCLGVIASLPVPEPFGLQQFRANLERHRGRPLLFLPTVTTSECSGMWVGTEEADFIFFARDTTDIHQRHIVVHEIAHMAFNHQGTRVGGDELGRLLFPDLSPSLVRLSLGRSIYSDEEEREAETFASVLLGRARPRPPASGLRPREAGLLQRIEGAFTIVRSGHGE